MLLRLLSSGSSGSSAPSTPLALVVSWSMLSAATLGTSGCYAHATADVSASREIPVAVLERAAPVAVDPSAEDDSERPPDDDVDAPPAALHFALVDHASSWANEPAFWACPLSGTAFVCGQRQLLVARGDHFEHDARLEVGLARSADGALEGTVVRMIGHWPDDAWLVSTTKGTCNGCSFAAYRWREDRWSYVSAFEDLASARNATTWKKSLVVAIASSQNGKNHGVLRAFGTDTPSALPDVRILPRHVAAVGGSLFVGGVDRGSARPSIERWLANGHLAGSEAVTPGPASITSMVVTNSGDPVVHGMTLGAKPEAFLARFDGTRWQAIDLPPDTRSISAYARAGRTEWAITDRTGGDKRRRTQQIWARGVSTSVPERWREITGWQAQLPKTLGALTAVTDLWLSGGVAWVAVLLESKTECVGIQGCPSRTALLRTGPMAPTQSLPL